jgi:hypothetical protein
VELKPENADEEITTYTKRLKEHVYRMDECKRLRIARHYKLQGEK